MKRLFVAVWLTLFAALAFALPTVEQVQAEVAKGNYAQAESLMRDVVAARPQSARAHYVYAEILAHSGRFEMAAEEVARARQLDPALTFTQPDRFAAFAQLVERGQAAARRANGTSGTGAATALPGTTAPAPLPARVRESAGAAAAGVPGWIWGLGLAILAFAGWRLFGARRRTTAAAGFPSSAAALPGGPPMGHGGQPGAFGAGPGGYGPGYAPPGRGSSWLGTGAAVAGGVAAGMLAEKLLDSHRESNAADAGAGTASGLQPGSFGAGGFDDAATQELAQRPVDFGSGDEWGGAADTGGSFDTGGDGGGSSDGDGW